MRLQLILTRLVNWTQKELPEIKDDFVSIETFVVENDLVRNSKVDWFFCRNCLHYDVKENPGPHSCPYCCGEMV